MSSQKLVSRKGLPAGKSTFDESELRAAIEHTRKMIRDGYTSGIWSMLNMAAGLYNLGEHLYDKMGYDTIEEAAQEEFGISRRHAFRYKAIGESLAAALGGGYIDQAMLKAHVKTHLYETRLGFRKILALAKTADGMQRLLNSKSEQDVAELIEELNSGAEEIEKAQKEKGTTPLKVAMKKNYDRTEASQSDITMLFGAAIRQAKELREKYVRKLDAALDSIPPDVLAQSKKGRRKAQEMWNELRQLSEAMETVAKIWPDQVPEIKRLRAQVHAATGGHAEPGNGTQKRRRRIDTTVAADIDVHDVSPPMTEEERAEFYRTAGLPHPDEVDHEAFDDDAIEPDEEDEA